MTGKAYKRRTHYCGLLNETHAGQTVVLKGWVDTRRDHGGLVFIDLRDREGIVQVVVDPQKVPHVHDIRNEYVLSIQGLVRLRPEGMVNQQLASGKIEVEVSELEVLSSARPLPFGLNEEKTSETLRLQYRYLDLRSKKLQKILRTRHQVMQLVRAYLSEQGFWEIETPILYKSTPEGARDYLVPSRVHKGSFYALPQSPQTLKQLLMVSGIDRYFQIARCFRDEDLRADRQPEFSQIDMEMSFVDEQEVMEVNENLLRVLWREIRGQEDIGDIPRMTYHDVMKRYGSDKPDLRIPWEIKDLSSVVRGAGFQVFEDVLERGDHVRGLGVPQVGGFSRSQWDKFTKMARQLGAKGLVWIKEDQGKLSSPAAKFLGEEKLREILDVLQVPKGGGAFIVADTFDVSSSVLGHFRSFLAHELNAIDTSRDSFLWVTDFPLFEFSTEEKRWVARHHPFTEPKEEDVPILLEGRKDEFYKVRARAYDLVCNGHELAGGGLRIYRQDLQQAMFRALSMSDQEAQEKFGYFLKALQYGTPPHGGIAWGLDRLLMILCETEAIRDVMAFPKTTKASCLMSEAPSPVDGEQLVELGIKLSSLTET
ncbi:MAG: aspartate--tRNA ligase [Bdellovibrio sp.]|nr:MAG: aspartate--tRNA ligase [Bdellovibrio sp.]